MRDIVGNENVGNMTLEFENTEPTEGSKLGMHPGEKSWLDPPVSIDIVLIAQITGLPKAGENLTTLFNKEGERALSEEMKEKFHTFRGKRGLNVTDIHDIDV
jgi:hypothetical protein